MSNSGAKRLKLEAAMGKTGPRISPVFRPVIFAFFPYLLQGSFITNVVE
jgi:hypothetical protein